MNESEAIQLLKNLLNHCVQKGVFNTLEAANQVNHAITILAAAAEKNSNEKSD